ncbi:hypothetical protein RhiirC2_770451 [Rhizophagus irregularis]|uniref:Uncharacterized protein n=1 Tax=Rhizophagus irregularis TaxID=588596 RepID=A0A2N1NWR2_9GLOM|nr:hypothetical protein RhiirC2_770451 [Rhizophagus irregularis]
MLISRQESVTFLPNLTADELAFQECIEVINANLLPNMHSELDLLRQENAKLLAENAKIKAKNVRLRQAIKDNVVKLTKLE